MILTDAVALALLERVVWLRKGGYAVRVTSKSRWEDEDKAFVNRLNLCNVNLDGSWPHTAGPDAMETAGNAPRHWSKVANPEPSPRRIKSEPQTCKVSLSTYVPALM